MQDYNQFREAVAGAQNIAPPETVGGNDPLVQNLYKGAFQSMATNAATQALGGKSVADKMAEDAARQQAIANAKAAQQKLVNRTDPSKWKLQRKDDGGFDIFDPDGNKKSVNDMARETNTDPRDILKDSDNPADIQYQQDYADLRDLLQAYAQNDRDAINSAIEQQPAIKGLTPQELLKRFRNAYPNVYGTYNANQATGLRKAGQKSLFGIGPASMSSPSEPLNAGE